MRRLALVLISGVALFGLQRSWADQPLQVSGHLIIPQGRTPKCALRSGCPCDFTVRHLGERCRVMESRGDIEQGENFDSHPERSWIVDAGSGTTACGVRLRCEFVPLVERCQFVSHDGGVGPPCSTSVAN